MILQSNSWAYSRRKLIWKDIYILMITAALFTILKIWKHLVSTDRWMVEDVVQIYNGILLSYKKEWNSAICRNVDGPRDYHIKWNKSEKDKYHVTYTWNLKKMIQIQNRNRVTDTNNNFMVTKGDGWGEIN